MTDIFGTRVIMAPMAGVNSKSFCEILIACGCRCIYTGLLASHGIVARNRRSLELATDYPAGAALIGQLFGSVPEVMAQAARMLEASGKFTAIDINMGCPVPKVIKNESGAGMMRNPERAVAIVKAIKSAIDLPVTVKMRSGWDSSNISCVDLARRVEDAGAAAIAIHPRTRVQGYSGLADMSHAAAVKDAVSIPVIASGDITDSASASRCLAQTGCDALMIGRAAAAAPWLIEIIEKHIEHNITIPGPSIHARMAIARDHFDRHIDAIGENRGVREMRGVIARYVKGLPGASALRGRLNTLTDPDAIRDLLLEAQNTGILLIPPPPDAQSCTGNDMPDVLS